MTRSLLSRVPECIAVVTLGVGAALVIAPRAVGTAGGLGDRPTAARVIGLMDLALVPGLLRGRPRWPWMVARALFNLPVAAVFNAEASRAEGHPVARPGRYVMLGLTVMDSVVAGALRGAERSSPA